MESWRYLYPTYEDPGSNSKLWILFKGSELSVINIYIFFLWEISSSGLILYFSCLKNDIQFLCVCVCCLETETDESWTTFIVSHKNVTTLRHFVSISYEKSSQRKSARFKKIFLSKELRYFSIRFSGICFSQ